MIQFLPLLAWAYFDLGDEARADATATDAVAGAAGEPMRLLLVDGLRIQALLALQQRRWRKALGAINESLARAIAYPYAEARALYVYELLHATRGEPGDACARLEAALAILARLGERMYAARVEEALAALASS